jgi:hypothetical protein
MTFLFGGFVPADDPIVKSIAVAPTAGGLADALWPQPPTNREA